MYQSSSQRAFRRTVRRTTAPADRPWTICVVDPEAVGYEGLEQLASASRLRLTLVASAQEALQIARRQSVDLWIVNTELPGFSGTELCSMLRQRNAQVGIYLMSDQISPDLERIAWAARPTMFGCKGQQHAWLTQWLEHRQCRPTAVVSG